MTTTSLAMRQENEKKVNEQQAPLPQVSPFDLKAESEKGGDRILWLTKVA